MKLADIKPRYIVLNQSYDDFAKDTEEIDYTKEDYLSQVVDITSVLYTNNLESIWGFLGFTWDVYNDYGHFNTISMPFSVIPRIPDGHRIKQMLSGMFDNITSTDIELLDSNFVNLETVEGILDNNNKRLVLHLHNTLASVFNFTTVSVNADYLLKYKGASIKIYCEDDKLIRFIRGFNYQSNTNNSFSYVIIDSNTKKLNVDYTGNTNDIVHGVIRYEEDNDFNIAEIISKIRDTTNINYIAWQAKNNKFIVPFKFAAGYNNYIYTIPYNDYTISDNLNNIVSNDLNNIFEYTIIDTVATNSRDTIALPALYYRAKKINFDIDINNLINKIDSFYNSSFINRLVVIPELNNLDWFLNESFETLIDVCLAFDSTNNLWNNIELYLPNKETIKVFDFKHSKCQIGQIHLLDYNGESVDDVIGYTIFPFKFINAENIVCNCISNNKQTLSIEDNKYVVSNTTQICYRYPLIVDSFTAAYAVEANATEPTITAKFIYMNYNPTTIFCYDDYSSPALVPPFKCIVTNNSNRHVFVLNYYFGYRIGGERNINLLTVFNNFIANGRNVLENMAIIDNPENYTFTINDRLHIGCGFIITSGLSYNNFKNCQMKYAGENYYVNTSDLQYAVNNTVYILVDAQQYNLIYNYNIFIVCIQTNIHNFVNAIANTEIPSGVIRTISIVHENYIQLSEEEKEKIINLGYILNDSII